MSKKRYVYYQPNKKDLKDKFGDCQIRALSKALDCEWIEAYDRAVAVCRSEQASMPFSTPLNVRRRILDALGFDYVGVSNKRGTVRPTIDSFAQDHKEGVYICTAANHVVAVVDGKYYDTWDSGYHSVYGYFVKR